VAAPVCAQSSRPSAVNSVDAAALSKALAAYDAGQTEAAKPELERLALKYPGNFPANEALGLIYVDTGDFARALPYLEHAANARKIDAVAQANLGAAYLQVGKTAEAVRVLRRAAALDGKNAQTLSNLGHALFVEKQPQEAARVFARAAAVDPANYDISYNWAVALFTAGKSAEAGEALRRIPEAQRSEAVESLWGDIDERQGRFKEAAEHIQRAAKLNPSEANIYALAIELLRHWSWQPATEVAEYGVRQFPDSRRLKLASGIAYFGNGRYPEAATIFGALLALDPDSESYGSLLGKSCAALGGASAPQCGSLVEFAERHPKNAQVSVYAATSLLHQSSGEQDLARAEGLLQQAIRTDGRLPEAYYQLGVLQQQRLQWKESAVKLERAVELRPAFAEAHYRLARAYSHLGQQELANKEIALQQQYSQQEKDETDARLKEVTTFLIASH
jgi:tetratricopeptide (TPR) repeat protein